MKIQAIDKNNLKKSFDIEESLTIDASNLSYLKVNSFVKELDFKILNDSDIVIYFEESKFIKIKNAMEFLIKNNNENNDLTKSFVLSFLDYDVKSYIDYIELLESSSASNHESSSSFFDYIDLVENEVSNNILDVRTKLDEEIIDNNEFLYLNERNNYSDPEKPDPEKPENPENPEKPDPEPEPEPDPIIPTISLISDNLDDDNKATVSIYGKGTPFATIEIFNNGVSIGFTQVDKDGNWIFTPEEFDDGTHLITAKESNNNGDTSESSEESKIVIGDGSSSIYPGLDGGNSVDYIYGGNGWDTLNASEGADVLDGGEGTDAVSYWDSTEGVIVDLSKGEGSGGYAQGDKYISIEDIYGSQYDDILIGDDNYNSVQAGRGNDTISNCENVHGDDGDDFITGTSGKDSLYGDNGNDTIYAGAGNDHVVGGNGDDILYGEEGNDTIFVGPGNDYVDGGEGIDKVGFSGDLKDYTIKLNDDGSLTITDNRDNSFDGENEIHNVEIFIFNGVEVSYESLVLIAKLTSLDLKEDIDLNSINNIISSNFINTNQFEALNISEYAINTEENFENSENTIFLSYNEQNNNSYNQESISIPTYNLNIYIKDEIIVDL